MSKPSSFRHASLCALAIISALALSSCGGGGALGARPPTTQNKVRVVALIDFPASPPPQSSSRSPKYISPSTNGATISVYPAGADTTPVFQQSDDLSSGSTLCSGSPRTCQIPMEVSPGTYDFVLTMYDASPVSGVIPSTAKELSTEKLAAKTIVANGYNQVTFALQGVSVGPPSLTCSPTPCGALNYWSLPADGAQHIFTIAVSAKDADGNTITGSNPYTAPITATLVESGGSGNTVLAVNGVAEGTTAVLTKPSDTLTIVYNGGGAPGYTTTTSIGGASLVMSPMYVVPDAAITEGLLTDSHDAAISEAGAGAGEVYTSSTTCSGVSPTVSGSGASASLSVATNVPGGTSASCVVKVADAITGAAISIPYTFAVPGPIVPPASPTLPSGVSGNCGSGAGTGTALNFTAVSQVATLGINDGGYTGAFSISNTTPSVATATISGNGPNASLSVTSASSGVDTIVLSDTAGNTMTCNVGVTVTSGSAS